MSNKKIVLKGHKDKNIARTLHISGILMMIASVFMATMPSLYAGVYYRMTYNTPMPQVDLLINYCMTAGVVISLCYCLVGLFVFRAGEQGTFLAKGLCVLNSTLAVFAIFAAVLIFLPIPDQTFAYAMRYYAESKNIDSGAVATAILAMINMACLVGLLISIAVIDDKCLIHKTKK